jgi:hypothetical protein
MMRTHRRWLQRWASPSPSHSPNPNPNPDPDPNPNPNPDPKPNPSPNPNPNASDPGVYALKGGTAAFDFLAAYAVEAHR